MFLKEYEGRELFEKYGIPVPRGVLLKNTDIESGKGTTGGKSKTSVKIETDFGNIPQVVLKAQLLSGKRGKRGGVVFADVADIEVEAKKLMGKIFDEERVEEILIEERIDIAQELYIGVTIDRFERRPVLLFSFNGGIDIEELADTKPDSIVKIFAETGGQFSREKMESKMLAGAGGTAKRTTAISESAIFDQLFDLTQKMEALLVKEDATLVEINPLVLTKDGKLLAADSKVIIDDNALSRHPDRLQRKLSQLTPLERAAQEFDLSYVELDGDLAIIGNGAGLVMATLDAVAHYGGRPANFCDVGGGADTRMMEKALEIVLKKSGVKGIFIDIFGGITHCDEIAEGILDYRMREKISIPMVVRMVGTNQDKAKEMLEPNGVHVFHSFEEAAQKAAQLSFV